jgi:hypothetical protein
MNKFLIGFTYHEPERWTLFQKASLKTASHPQVFTSRPPLQVKQLRGQSVLPRNSCGYPTQTLSLTGSRWVTSAGSWTIRATPIGVIALAFFNLSSSAFSQTLRMWVLARTANGPRIMGFFALDPAYTGNAFAQ